MLCRFNFSHLRLDEIIDYGSAPSGKLRIEVLVLADFQGFLWELWPRLSTNLGGWCAKEVHHPGRDHSCGLGRELQELLLMEQILHQLRLVVYPIIYMVSYIPGCLGFLPSTEGHIGIWPATQILSCSPSLSLAFEKPATSWQFIAILGQDTLQSLPESLTMPLCVMILNLGKRPSTYNFNQLLFIFNRFVVATFSICRVVRRTSTSMTRSNWKRLRCRPGLQRSSRKVPSSPWDVYWWRNDQATGVCSWRAEGIKHRKNEAPGPGFDQCSPFSSQLSSYPRHSNCILSRYNCKNANHLNPSEDLKSNQILSTVYVEVLSSSKHAAEEGRGFPFSLLIFCTCMYSQWQGHTLFAGFHWCYWKGIQLRLLASFGKCIKSNWLLNPPKKWWFSHCF